ncbi:hypothetical protein [Pararhizobium sp.]|uniref:hypothetical protein n=1 Tax=Pararhizobium sp. TaxID=1977563 RepID=UPI0027232284|nr:hypothetical protein [Pararhizobium sp.]MDO9417987.1 hypothetical protein [Pararhizobium sp.]
MTAPLTLFALAASLAAFSPPGFNGDRATTVLAAGDCSAAAAQVVAETGGELLSAQPQDDGTCTVTVLVPGQGNERPKKVKVRVPM